MDSILHDEVRHGTLAIALRAHLIAVGTCRGFILGSAVRNERAGDTEADTETDVAREIVQRYPHVFKGVTSTHTNVADKAAAVVKTAPPHLASKAIDLLSDVRRWAADGLFICVESEDYEEDEITFARARLEEDEAKCREWATKHDDLWWRAHAFEIAAAKRDVGASERSPSPSESNRDNNAESLSGVTDAANRCLEAVRDFRALPTITDVIGEPLTPDVVSDALAGLWVHVEELAAEFLPLASELAATHSWQDPLVKVWDVTSSTAHGACMELGAAVIGHVMGMMPNTDRVDLLFQTVPVEGANSTAKMMADRVEAHTLGRLVRQTKSVAEQVTSDSLRDLSAMIHREHAIAHMHRARASAPSPRDSMSTRQPSLPELDRFNYAIEELLDNLEESIRHPLTADDVRELDDEALESIRDSYPDMPADLSAAEAPAWFTAHTLSVLPEDQRDLHREISASERIADENLAEVETLMMQFVDLNEHASRIGFGPIVVSLRWGRTAKPHRGHSLSLVVAEPPPMQHRRGAASVHEFSLAPHLPRLFDAKEVKRLKESAVQALRPWQQRVQKRIDKLVAESGWDSDDEPSDAGDDDADDAAVEGLTVTIWSNRIDGLPREVEEILGARASGDVSEISVLAGQLQSLFALAALVTHVPTTADPSLQEVLRDTAAKAESLRPIVLTPLRDVGQQLLRQVRGWPRVNVEVISRLIENPELANRDVSEGGIDPWTVLREVLERASALDLAASHARAVNARRTSRGPTGRAKKVLKAMWALGAIDEAHKKSQEVIVRRIDKQADRNNFGDVFSTLRARGLVSSMTGPDGGTWLTESGVTVAQTLS